MDKYLTITDVARCMGQNLKEADRIVSKAGLRQVQYQGRMCYLRQEIVHWLSMEFGSLVAERLAAAELSNAEIIGIDPSTLLVTDRLFGHIVFPDRVGTASSMIRIIAQKACETGYLFDEKALRRQLILREEESTTALRCGVALVHPLKVSELYVERSLLMLFRPPHPLPFGEESGRLTALFFLLVFPKANEHLHVLARLMRMLRSSEFVENMIMAQDPNEILKLIEHRETCIVSDL